MEGFFTLFYVFDDSFMGFASLMLSFFSSPILESTITCCKFIFADCLYLFQHILVPLWCHVGNELEWVNHQTTCTLGVWCYHLFLLFQSLLPFFVRKSLHVMLHFFFEDGDTTEAPDSNLFIDLRVHLF